MSWGELVARIFGVEGEAEVRSLRLEFAANWAEEGPAWLFFGILAAIGVSVYLVSRGSRASPSPPSRALRVALVVLRALVLGGVLLALAGPVLQVAVASYPRPFLFLLFDESESMGIVDREDPEAISRWGEALVSQVREDGAVAPDRLEWTRRRLLARDAGVLRALAERFRLRAFRFGASSGAEITPLDLDLEQPGAVAASLAVLEPRGEVSAIGGALLELARQPGAARAAGVVVFSDFAQNSGPSAIEAARKIGCPLHTVGLGPAFAEDLAVDLNAPALTQKGERTRITVTLRREAEARAPRSPADPARRGPAPRPQGERVRLRVTSSSRDGEPSEFFAREIRLDGEVTRVEIPWTPPATGSNLLVARVDPPPGDAIEENDVREREVIVRDEFVRLFHIEQQPNWEWRFLRQIFERDPLVGERGYRTFLRSADPRVRQSNESFLTTMTPRRSEFFASDVLFLGDLPRSSLGTRLPELAREFVARFGGGLVIIAGPRFGPGELVATPFEEMLPVRPVPGARRRTGAFRPERTAEGMRAAFLRLGDTNEEDERAWERLGELPWYHEIAAVDPLASVLLVHPDATCDDGVTPIPLIARRRFGRGEVVYVGLNELWRLRRGVGDRYYRRFWGQLIQELGLQHTLGQERRFVVRTDRESYRADDRVRVVVEAYDGSYEPLEETALEELGAPEGLEGEWTANGASRRLTLAYERPGVFSTSFRVIAAGEHRLRVRDPIRDELVEIAFRVEPVSVERRRAARDVALESELVEVSGGRAWTLATLDNLAQDIPAKPEPERVVRALPLAESAVLFGLLLALLAIEWVLRRSLGWP